MDSVYDSNEDILAPILRQSPAVSRSLEKVAA